MRNLFSTRVKIILVIAALLTAGLAILSGITNTTPVDLVVQGFLAPFRAAGTALTTTAEKYYGYKVSVIDLRNPSRSDGHNLLTVINHWMDRARKDPKDLGARAKAEKYAKLLAKTIVNPEGDSGSRG